MGIAQIRKAYLDLARTHHSDKGGDPEKFTEIDYTYYVLNDNEKRSKDELVGMT